MRIIVKFRNGFSIASARHFYLFVVITGALYWTCFFYLTTNFQSDSLKFKWWLGNDSSRRKEDDASKNYFQDSSRLEKLGRVVETSTCHIPDFDVFDEDVLPFIKIAQPIEKSNETHYNWSYVRGNILFLNRTQIAVDGYSFRTGFCCYKIVQRVTLTKEEEKNEGKLKNADNLIRYSKCVDITQEETQIRDEFIVVECGNWKFAVGLEAYRGFHATAVISNSSHGKNVRKKVDFWKSVNQEDPIPPNILILGLDSTSRLNFRRNMFQTRKVLEELEAVEMKGYTKVGENTFPNFVPLTTGYSEEDLVKICYFTRWTKQDDCPYIWNSFDSANYITAHSEDAPFIAIFNYLKTGFVQQPVDFYLRPMFLAAHDYGYPPLYSERKYSMDCIGPKTNDEMILSYVESVLELGHKNRAPVYSVSWSSQGSHDDLNAIQLVDDTYSTFLLRMKEKGYLDNTMLIFMGDHGYRFGPIRQTLLGYYEDKLPNMWIRIPPWVKEDYFPEWEEALETNSRRLTSPYTLYWTLNLILEMFSAIESPPDAVEAKNKTGLDIARKHRQNFFEVVPENNTCLVVGVPEQYCACYVPSMTSLDDPLVKGAVVKAIAKTNKDLISKCAQLTVKAITSATIAHKPSSRVKRIVVAFTTFPGDFVLEAEIDYFMNNKSFSEFSDIHRASKINPNYITCIKDSHLELFCYCVS